MSTQVNNQTVGDINNANVANVNNNTQKASKQSKQKGFNKGKRFEQNCHWWIWVTNILLLGVNVFILCRYAPASDELDFDYYGVIVGVLSILVTALLGFNIYSVIDLKAIQHDNEKLAGRINLVERSYNNGLEQVETTLAMLFFYERRNSNNAFLAYQSIYHWLRAIAMASEKENFNACAGYVVSLLVCTKELPVLSKGNKDLLRHAYNQIPNKEKIQDIGRVDNAIDEIKTDNN